MYCKAVLLASLLGCVGVALVGAAPAPAGSSISFNAGTLAVRPGCYLEGLGKPKKLFHEAHGPCGDAEDQATWQEGLKAWEDAAGTWVDHCTAQGTTPMAKNCPPQPLDKVFKNNGAYKPKTHTWVQYYVNKQADYMGVKAYIDNSLMDVRINKLMLHKANFKFYDAYLYMTNGGIVGFNGSQVYMEDTEGWKMGCATIGVNAKMGAIKSDLVMNGSVFAMKQSKVWLQDSTFKQLNNAFVLQDTVMHAAGSKLEFWDTNNIHIVRSTLNLTGSDLLLTRSKLYLWDSTIVVKDTNIVLDNSRMLLSNVGILGEGFILSAEGIPEAFGVTPGSQVDAMNIDFLVEGKAKAVLAADNKATNGG